MRITRQKFCITYRDKTFPIVAILYKEKIKSYMFFIRFNFLKRYITIRINNLEEEKEKNTVEYYEFRNFFNEIIKNDNFNILVKTIREHFIQNDGM